MIARRDGRDEFRFLRVAPLDRRDVFFGAATRLGTPEQNVEKDFWVAWTLDVLFNGLPAGHPRFLFKGGTSLSKAYGPISRFSEDIDITVFREDIGQAASVRELQSLSRKKRQSRLDTIKNTCREYIQSTLAQQFGEVVRATLVDSNIDMNVPNVVVDADDPDRQTLLFWYPSVTAGRDNYIRPAVKIESGAKSALDPHEDLSIVPYVSEEVPQLARRAEHVTTVVAERTFWDKIIIVHGVRSWFENAVCCAGRDNAFRVTTTTSIGFFNRNSGREPWPIVRWMWTACPIILGRVLSRANARRGCAAR